jgi:hypothetical protein
MHVRAKTYAGVQFLEFFIGPNYSYKWAGLHLQGIALVLLHGLPDARPPHCRAPDYTAIGCNRQTRTTLGAPPSNCLSTYNFSHNLEIIPAVEYRLGRWSFYDRIIFHNTFYADTYSSDRQ